MTTDPWAALRARACACQACPLAATRTQVVFGSGSPTARLMFVGEGPGAQEDLTGEPFVGRSGQLLTRLIQEIGLGRGDVMIANVVKCRPPDNRNPKPDEIAACRPFLEEQLDLVDPDVVVPLGNFATQLLLGTKMGITKLRGQTFPYRERSMIIPTLHPAAVLRGGNAALEVARADFARIQATLEARR